MNEEPLSFAGFQEMLAQVLQIAEDRLQPDAYFITDLGVDSLRLVEIMLRLEGLGLDISPDLIWEIQTVGDAYRYYQRHRP